MKPKKPQHPGYTPAHNIDPAAMASEIITANIKRGLKKHPGEKWRIETDDEHCLKAARHVLSARLVGKGYSPKDRERHLENALTRLAMCIANRRAAGIKVN